MCTPFFGGIKPSRTWNFSSFRIANAKVRSQKICSEILVALKCVKRTNCWCENLIWCNNFTFKHAFTQSMNRPMMRGKMRVSWNWFQSGQEKISWAQYLFGLRGCLQERSEIFTGWTLVRLLFDFFSSWLKHVSL